MFFTDLLGNEETKNNLKALASEKKMPHAIIISGPDGSGKKAMAEYISLLLNCKNAPIPCLKCTECQKILNCTSPDVVFTTLEPSKQSIGVDVIRNIRQDVYVKPNDNETKIYVIEHADKLTIEAQNAFLKVYEEPPSYAYFILLCNSPEALLITIKSRGTLFKTDIFTPSEIYEYLCSRGYLEKYSENDLFLASALSKGAVGKAFEILSDSLDEKRELFAKCIELLSLLCKRSSAFDLYVFMLSLSATRQYLMNFLSMFKTALGDLLSQKLCKNSPVSFFANEDVLLKYSDGLSCSFITETISYCENVEYSLNNNANVQTTLNALAASLAKLRDKY